MAYWIGFILGRLLASYIMVWVVFFLMTKFQYKESVRRLHSKKGVVAIVVVFLVMGLISLARHLSNGGASI